MSHVFSLNICFLINILFFIVGTLPVLVLSERRFILSQYTHSLESPSTVDSFLIRFCVDLLILLLWSSLESDCEGTSCIITH